MPRCPAADWRPLGTNYTRGGCAPRLVVLHIMQGSLNGTDSWFRNPAAQVSAHFGTGKDGRLYQWVDTHDTAWHAAAANGFSIGIENEGYAGEALTGAQLAAVARVVAWAEQAHGVPLQVCNTPSGHGLAWHGLGGAAWGGHYQCPGDPIIAQRPAILAAATGHPTAGGDDEMTPAWLPSARVAPLAFDPAQVGRIRFAGTATETIRVDWLPSPQGHAGTVSLDLGYAVGARDEPVPAGCEAARVIRADLPAGETEYPLVSVCYVPPR